MKKTTACRPCSLIRRLLALLLIGGLSTAAGEGEGEDAGGESARPADIPLPHESLYTGDLHGMLERRQIRMLVAYNKMFYFLDGATQRGGTYEMAKLFEAELNRKLKTKARKLHIIFIPVPREELIPALLEGRGDIAAANLSITPIRLAQVDFSAPFMDDAKQVVVSGVHGPPVETLDDLAGQPIFFRVDSSYEESLKSLNERFAAEDKPLMHLIPLAPFMEDSDILELVDAGLIPLTIVDLHKAAFWEEMFKDIKVHEDVAVRTGGKIAWAIRKDSPGLKAVLDAFVAGHKMGTLHGNILYKRYLERNKWVRHKLTEKELAKFRKFLELFRKYADQYDLDELMIAALAYQESGLDQKKRSDRGAVGIMQVMPTTATDPNVAIPDIHLLEPNIHAGTKYLRFLYDRYFADQPMSDLDKMLFSFAAYNAGPAKVRRLRKHAEKMGLDPDRWFRNVEVATARKIGAETVQYVANIYKYYTAYRLMMDKLALTETSAEAP